MTDLTKIEERLALALTRIRDVTGGDQAGLHLSALQSELDEARERAETLAEELLDLKALRNREADELDVLIAQLSPYLEDAQNA